MHGEDAVVVGQELAKGGSVTLTVARKSGPKPTVVIPPRTVSENAALKRGLNEVVRRLRKNGASPAFVERVIAATEGKYTALHDGKSTPDVHVLDVAAEAIGALFTTIKLPRAHGKARVLALAGAGGVGKTTTIAKLALRLVQAQRRVELITFDAERPGAVEQLRAWADVLGTPFRVARSGSELDVQSVVTADLLLVDTCGRPERDLARLSRTQEACAAAGADLETYVVLSAGASGSTLRAITSTLSRLEPKAVVITKLDETDEPVGVLEHVLEANLPVAFFSDGPDVHQNLHRAAPAHFGDLCLLGRIA